MPAEEPRAAKNRDQGVRIGLHDHRRPPYLIGALLRADPK